MKVIVGCEESGRVRDAFIARGHDAVSCDIIPTSVPGPHIQGDIREVDLSVYDLAIFHPPCTYLCTSGARWAAGESAKAIQRRADRDESVEFVKFLADAPVEMIAIENPIGHLSSVWRKPDQIVHPWMFGEALSKATCLWLKNLPTLAPTKVVEPEFVISGTGRKWSKWFWDTSMINPLSLRSTVRSKTFQGIADAMADQWGSL